MEIRKNTELNGLEIIFDSKPNAETLTTLKENGFRWHKVKKLWYAKETADRIAVLASISGSDVVIASLPTIEDYTTTATDGYMGATEYTGNNYASGRRLYGSDLSKAIREELKRCKITNCFVKSKTFSGGQEITVTVKADANTFVSREEFVNRFDISNLGYWCNDTDGRNISTDSVYCMDSDKQRAVVNYNANCKYDYLTNGEHDRHNYVDFIFTESFVNKLKFIQAVLNSFNHDDSNSMVDYFDRHFYDNIYIKAE